MNNAEKFQEVFGYYATEMWAKSEKEFLDWANAEYNTPITPTERHTGAWIEDGYYDYPYYVCSNCGQKCGTQNNGVEMEPLCTKYCPNCGARMKE